MLKRKHYKFTDKKTSKWGVASTIVFLVALILLGFGVYQSFQAHGNGGITVGILGFFSFVAATVGAVLGLNSLKDEDVFHTFSWIGSVGNAVLWFFILLLIMIGW